jgi:transposase
MMGQQPGAQDQLFYSFNLEVHVPVDHLLRGIDRFLDLSELRRHLASFYSHTGRPSIDPELMIRMLLVGYCFGIRSERRLCEEVHLNLAYRWFCRLGLEDKVPDHSSFSKNRHGRFRESGAFRHVFESTVQRCMAEGLVGGEVSSRPTCRWFPVTAGHDLLRFRSTQRFLRASSTSMPR